MGIEFNCTECGKLLRTPDGSGGKRAKCPQCGALLAIPDPAFAATITPPPAPVLAGDASNPYQSPTAYEDAVPLREIQPTRITVEDVLNQSWGIFRQHTGALILVVLGIMILQTVVGQMLAMGVIFGGKDLPQFAQQIITQIISAVVTTFFTLGLSNYVLKIVRGQPTQASDAFAGAPYFVSALCAYLLFVLAIIVGLICLIIPAIIFSLMFSQYTWVILDRNCGPIEALQISSRITKGNKWTLFLLYLLFTFGGTALVLFTCGIGAIVVLPVAFTAMAVCYVKMSGQSTVLDRAPLVT